MMKYFRLLDDMRSASRWHLGAITFVDGTEPLLTSGIRLELEGHLSTPIHHPGIPLDFCLTSFAVPVVTPELAQAIATVVGSDVQCLPLQIVGHSNRVALNVVRMVECVDEARSEFVKWTEKDRRPDLAGQYRVVRKLVVDPGTIPPDAHCFRIRSWDVAVIVSEVVKDAMVRAGCDGADFRDVNPPTGE